jgi:hypothetical protein
MRCFQTPFNPNEVPKDFSFHLVYGTYGKKQIDTFHGTIVKDLIDDGTVEANISFTKQEMKEIYQRMMEIKVMEIVLRDKQECVSEPPSLSIWNIKMNGIEKSIQYDSSYCDYPEDVLNLMKLEDFIHEMMAKKDTYKELPEPNGYYE